MPKPGMTPEEKDFLDEEARRGIQEEGSEYYASDGGQYRKIEPDLANWQSKDGIKGFYVKSDLTSDGVWPVDFGLGDRRLVAKDMPYYGLSELDKKEIMQAMPTIVQEILKNRKDNWPKAVVLPETSGRPLAYLLRPIFEKIASELPEHPMPQFVFFKTPKWKMAEYAYSVMDWIENEETTPILQKNPYEWSEEENRKIREAIESKKSPMAIDYEGLVFFLKSEILMKNRAQEILNHGITVSDLIFVDESFINGGTVDYLAQAFGVDSEDIEFYPIVASEKAEDYGTDYETGDRRYLWPNVHPGAIFGTGEDERGVFDYKFFARPHGVTKSNLGEYAEGTIHDRRSYIEARNLRNDMHNLGLEIADSIDMKV